MKKTCLETGSHCASSVYLIIKDPFTSSSMAGPNPWLFSSAQVPSFSWAARAARVVPLGTLVAVGDVTVRKVAVVIVLAPLTPPSDGLLTPPVVEPPAPLVFALDREVWGLVTRLSVARLDTPPHAANNNVN